MDRVEAVGLLALGERKVWKVDQLPLSADIDVLRCLDAEEMVEVRYVTAVNGGRAADGTRELHPQPSAWFSPMRRPEMAGGWETILRPQKFDERNLPSELRVSERGRAELARLRRSLPVRLPSGPEVQRARAEAAAFRLGGSTVYPGVLLAIRSGSFALVPIEDLEFNPDRESLIGVAMWGGLPKQPNSEQSGGADPGDHCISVPLIAADTRRPRTGSSLADAWIARADVVRTALAGSVMDVVDLGAIEAAAAVHEVVMVLRERASQLIRSLPRDARDARRALATVVDEATPTLEQLDEAVKMLIASVDGPVASLPSDELEAPAATAGRDVLVPNPCPPRPLRDEHWTVLCHLRTLLSPVDASRIAGTHGLPKYHKLIRLLRELEIEKLVGRPFGERSGWIILEEGRTRLDANGFAP